MTQKRKSYSLENKLKAVETAKRSNTFEAAAHFQVYESTIQKPRLNETKLKANKQLYDNWMVHGDRQEAAVGNPEPPPHGSASVKTCGISTATYESEDDLIHCIKPNGTTAAALEEARILDGAAMEEALVLDDEDAALLDVSH